MRIGIDFMGGDTSPSVLFDAVLRIAEELDASSSLIVLTTQDVIDELAKFIHPVLSSPHAGRVIFHVVTDVIEMGDDPIQAVRTKKGSSLVMGIRLLKKQHIDALVSVGNTGALITSATLSLPLLPGIRRPALLAMFPTQRGHVAVVDVGGNVSSKPQHLVQFAKMGAAYQRCRLGIDRPTIGLLNIGVESKKGSVGLRQVHELLQGLDDPRLRFVGNVEGRDLFQGKVDVLVTDGFTGNVLLKASEGVASFIFGSLQEGVATEASAGLKQSFFELQRYFDDSEYPGAIVCGVDGVVVKCHGHSGAKALYNGIRGAVHLVQHRFVEQIKEQLQR